MKLPPYLRPVNCLDPDANEQIRKLGQIARGEREAYSGATVECRACPGKVCVNLDRGGRLENGSGGGWDNLELIVIRELSIADCDVVK